jgi:hypothetical protein
MASVMDTLLVKHVALGKTHLYSFVYVPPMGRRFVAHCSRPLVLCHGPPCVPRAPWYVARNTGLATSLGHRAGVVSAATRGLAARPTTSQ